MVDAAVQPQPAERPSGAHPLLGFALVVVGGRALGGERDRLEGRPRLGRALRHAPRGGARDRLRADPDGGGRDLPAAARCASAPGASWRSWRSSGSSGSRSCSSSTSSRSSGSTSGSRSSSSTSRRCFVALWARFVVKEPVRRRIWVAIGLALLGLALVVELVGGMTLDGVGVAACLVTAVAYAAYVLMAERSAPRGARPVLAPRLGLHLLGALLGRRPAVVELPVGHGRRQRLAARAPGGRRLAGVAPARLPDRARDGRPVPAHGHGAPLRSRRRG